ncbi:hypothetical protein AK812_SmicGene30992 [Symbiodinium microadriaticum]|uniref:Uncharacterized protein n=1 Tax=Symbiodinium microadriaticum TaxID=2951 RepID=A0A1Q9CXZ0_SYMMI|nr:hypothetical protein AK812_SmicGene30992 [Symbiodinium microadriaticum]
MAALDLPTEAQLAGITTVAQAIANGSWAAVDGALGRVPSLCRSWGTFLPSMALRANQAMPPPPSGALLTTPTPTLTSGWGGVTGAGSAVRPAAAPATAGLDPAKRKIKVSSVLDREDRCRAERFPKLRRKLLENHDHGLEPRFQPGRPWERVFRVAAQDKEKWDEHVRDPAIRHLRGVTGSGTDLTDSPENRPAQATSPREGQGAQGALPHRPDGAQHLVRLRRRHVCSRLCAPAWGARAPDPPEVGQPVPPQDGGPEAGGAGTAAEEAGEEPALLEPKGGVTKAVREALQGTSFKVWDPLDKNGDTGSDLQAQAFKPAWIHMAPPCRTFTRARDDRKDFLLFLKGLRLSSSASGPQSSGFLSDLSSGGPGPVRLRSSRGDTVPGKETELGPTVAVRAPGKHGRGPVLCPPGQPSQSGKAARIKRDDYDPVLGGRFPLRTGSRRNY